MFLANEYDGTDELVRTALEKLPWFTEQTYDPEFGKLLLFAKCWITPGDVIKYENEMEPLCTLCDSLYASEGLVQSKDEREQLDKRHAKQKKALPHVPKTYTDDIKFVKMEIKRMSGQKVEEISVNGSRLFSFLDEGSNIIFLGPILKGIRDYLRVPVFWELAVKIAEELEVRTLSLFGVCIHYLHFHVKGVKGTSMDDHLETLYGLKSTNGQLSVNPLVDRMLEDFRVAAHLQQLRFFTAHHAAVHWRKHEYVIKALQTARKNEMSLPEFYFSMIQEVFVQGHRKPEEDSVDALGRRARVYAVTLWEGYIKVVHGPE